MYAIVKTGGKQYKCEIGKVITVEKIDGNIGDAVVLKDVVLAVGENSSVSSGNFNVFCKIVAQKRDSKIIVFKKQRRTANFTRKMGHRQYLTSLLVQEIKQN